jgi:hypothetical protein
MGFALTRLSRDGALRDIALYVKGRQRSAGRGAEKSRPKRLGLTYVRPQW